MLTRNKHLFTSTASVKATSEAERLLTDASISRHVAEYLEKTGFSTLEEAIASGGVFPNRPQRHYRPRGRRFRHGRRAAALRAVTAAKAYRRGDFPSLVAAAEAHGSNVAYVAAAIVVLQGEDAILLAAVLDGSFPLLEAAKRAKPVADLVTAFRAAGPADLSAAGSIIGSAAVWDSMISPII